MPWADKTRKGLEGWFTKPTEPGKPSWGDRLRAWMASWVVKGVDDYLKAREPELIALGKDYLLKIKAMPGTSPELKSLIDKSLETGDIFTVIVGWLMTLVGVIPQVFGWGAPLGRVMEYAQDSVVESARFEPAQAIAAWRRDPVAYTELLDDLKDLGWAKERIEAFKFITLFLPNPQDLIRFAVREVYSPEIAEKFGQFQDFPELAMPDAEKIGLTREVLSKYWAAHWDLPSPMQGFEMLHRQIISEDELKMLLRALDVMPFWRDKLIAMSWNTPTRVDIRRFFQMGVIDEPELRRLYTAFGYHGVDLDHYVEFTKRYVAGDATTKEKELTKTEIYKGVKTGKLIRDQGVELLMDLGYDEDTAAYLLDINIPPDETEEAATTRELTKADIISGLKAGVIDEAKALSLLQELRYTAADAGFLLKLYKATIKPPEEAKGKEASKADIITAVKKGLITAEDGYLMLQEIGFTPEAAQFILSVQAETSPFSPLDYAEYKDLTQKYRRSQGMEAKPVSEELKKAAAEKVRLTGEVKSLQGVLTAEEKTLIGGEVLPAAATKRRDELRVALHRAESELELATRTYNNLVAQWRQGV
jgi:hypothetical protein